MYIEKLKVRPRKSRSFDPLDSQHRADPFTPLRRPTRQHVRSTTSVHAELLGDNEGHILVEPVQGGRRAAIPLHADYGKFWRPVLGPPSVFTPPQPFRGSPHKPTINYHLSRLNKKIQ